MKNTALTQTHIDLGAKMVEFAGYNMPIQYEGVTVEHEEVRSNAGIFDVSHMGEFMIEGPKAIELIQKISSNDASKLVDGQAQYSCMPNNDGGIVDDLLVYRINEEKFMLVVNASNIDKDWTWISKFNENIGATMTNLSDEFSLLAIQGPNSVALLQKLTNVNLTDIKYYTFVVDSFAGHDNIIISATGYTGEKGFELYIPNDSAKDIWNKITELGVKPIGLAARDTLRLEMGFCLYGNDINDTTSPLEAGLGWITKFTKDFVNSDNLKRQKEDGVSKKLIAFEMIDKGIPRKDYELVDSDGNAIGVVTSGTQSPSTKKGIGLGYVSTNFSKLDTEIYVSVRNKSLKAQIVKLPFYKNN